MALNIGILVQAIRRITDKDFEEFEGFPIDDAATAARWAAAFKSYMQEVTMPPPSPGAVLGHDAGELAMKVALGGMSLPGSALIKFPLGFKAYVLAFAPSNAPAFVCVPPPADFLMPSLPIVPPPTATAAALVLATAVHGWVTTATATPAVGAPTKQWE